MRARGYVLERKADLDYDRGLGVKKVSGSRNCGFGTGK